MLFASCAARKGERFSGIFERLVLCETAGSRMAIDCRNVAASSSTEGVFDETRESEADRTITQRVRQGVVAHDGLSMTATNVKIVTVDGIVTLRGPVLSQEELNVVTTIARQVEGVRRVDNQLEIASR